MVSFLVDWLGAVWTMLVDSAPYLLFGLVLAGLVWLVVNERNIGRTIKNGGMKGVLKAALFGIPLPLCSCSVLPVAVQLSRSGVKRGPTVSFLISTPESGVDSIMLTYSLTDPLLTVARPVTAFLTAMAAGFVETAFSETEPSPVAETACGDACGCQTDNAASVNRPWPVRLWTGIRYAFTDLLKDIMREMRNEGKTIIFSTHVMHEAEKLCDSILLINKGQAILDDSLANIKSRRSSHIVSAELEGNTDFIEKLPIVKAVQSDGKNYEITLSDSADTQQLLKVLAERLHVQRFEVKVPSLHEIFVELVGTSNEENS